MCHAHHPPLLATHTAAASACGVAHTATVDSNVRSSHNRGAITGITLSSLCGVLILVGIIRSVCKRKTDHTEHLTEMEPPAIK